MPADARQTEKRNHYRNEPDWMAAGYGPGSVTLSSELAVVNSSCATAGVAAESVSAVVGFNVSQTRTLKVEYSYNAPDDKREWTVQGGNEEFVHTYDIHTGQDTLDAGEIGPGQAVKVGKLVFRYYPSGQPPPRVHRARHTDAGSLGRLTLMGTVGATHSSPSGRSR